VKNQCNNISRLHQVEVTCNVGELPPAINENVALTLFRVLQEALHNTVKHSHATKASIELFSENGDIQLKVMDNGTGFDPGIQDISTGLGLVSMKERLELVGGMLSISSQPSGTQLNARVPIGDSPHDVEAPDGRARQILAA
jgi:two-component system NarL family sensor kinase